ncbi:MAG TPA: tRNA pseudouridine(13) synthase TruD [Gammaproteobacteria bacterium]|jgi:tRNA pseudouridine13 synthase|nr:tRNA pseudouridine(13) synthase TruD [Gammaproteobacteria bacterium]
MNSGLPAWARAHGPVTARGRLKTSPEDFRVDEVLGFEADGEGPHALLTVEKRGANTRWVAAELARYAGLQARDVGYAGLKDRHAVTMQHFTVPIEGRPEPDWSAIPAGDFRVLKAVRQRRKLKIGALEGNRFRIILRDLSQPAESLLPKLEIIAKHGVPNYFGLQRFGHGGGNIAKAEAMLVGGRRIHDRRLRSMLLSSARSLIFNDLLSERVKAGSWDRLLSGEVLMLDGSHSVFKSDASDTALEGRLAEHDVHPTGPLWGRGEPATAGEARALEDQVVQAHAALAKGLEAAGLAAARRALRLPVRELAWELPDAHTLVLGFFLPAGAYATTVLQELLETESAVEGDDAHED